MFFTFPFRLFNPYFL